MPDPESPQSPGLPPAPAVDDLQFQKAEFAPVDTTPRCTLCRAEISETYYHCDGSAICKVCAGLKLASQEPVRGRVFWKSVLYGLGAAAAGSALYGIVLLATGAEFALLSILVGIMVGKAMLLGSGGRGGRKLQIAAVLLTYGSITTGYVPSIAKEMGKLYKKQSKAGEPITLFPKKAGVASVDKPLSPGRAVLAVVVFVAFIVILALAAPFLSLTQGFSGILGVAIIFFGLQRAWHKMKGDNSVLMGPYPVADLTPPAATA